MKTTGLFTIHEFTIPIEELGNPIYMIPFGDVHKDAPLHSQDKWHEFLEWAEKHKNAYFLGMGDYNDFISTSERKAYDNADFHDSTKNRWSIAADDSTDAFYNDISFMKGRLLGLIEGNHFFKYSSGITSTQKLCERLDCKYLGCMTIIRIRFVWKDHSVVKDLCAHHGKGAAQLLGGSLNNVEKMMAGVEADIFLMGHDHKGPVGFIPRMKLSQSMGHLALVERKIFLGRTGSFLRGYVPGEVSYIADSCLNPANLGVMKIDFIPQRKYRESLSVDMPASI